jgi:3-phytase
MRTARRLLPLLALLAPSPVALAVQPTPITVPEWFFTTEQPRENIDSPAVWHGPGDRRWLLATSKEGHSINVYDALHGRFLRRVGGRGIELGQFDRPNGIAVVDDYLFVVERDNRRVQILSLPDLQGLATFGETELRKPYGLWVHRQGPGDYRIYVTDSYETPAGEVPPAAELGQRVRVYQVEARGPLAEGELVATFGDTSGPGVLHIVESIHGDPAHDRLLVADEAEDAVRGLDIKVYDLAGRFTGRSFGKSVFKYQAEGIALFPTGEKSGLWICTDQGKTENLFHVFDRETLAHLGSFRGEHTLNTDGVWLDARPLPRMPLGAFYAVDADKAVAAFSWAEVLAALGLDPGT